MDAEQVLNSFLGTPGAYVHVPFCQPICPFCPYNKVVYQEDLARRYFRALRAEIDQSVEHMAAPFSSLYIGGGTPSLCLEDLAPIVAAIPVHAERAMEMLPPHATRERLDQLHQMGINYISLGIQSFDGEMLSYLKRPTSTEANLQAIDRVTGSFDCVNVDLIFDVAFADERVFLQDLETCFSKGVEQISTYPLMRFGYTPFGKSKHDRRREHSVLGRAQKLAARYGYERRSAWTFNREDAPDYSSIARPFYLGFGAGSASYTGRFFLVNHFSINRYIDKVQSGRLPIARRFVLSPFASSAYGAFWQAYTGRIDTNRITSHFGYPAGLSWRMMLHVLTLNRWFHRDDAIFWLTPKGQDHYHDIERWVTYHFLEPLWGAMMREHEMQ